MKAQEALHEISTMVFRNTDNFEMRISKDCYKNIVNALEKQIPKEPLNIKEEYDGDYGECPNCENIVSDYRELKYCNSCGQALDWELTEKGGVNL